MTKGPSTSVIADSEEEVSHDETSLHEESEPKQEVFMSHPQPNVPQPVYTNMYMPYIEGLKMDWTVNDTLYHRFLKWELKYKNILECEHTALPNVKNVRMLSLGLVTLEWISMYPGGYPKRNLILTQFGRDLKIFVSHYPMRSKPSSIL